MHYLIDLITTVGYFGYAIVFVIILLESFPPTFFLPGDSLLFTTGFLASQGYFNFALLVGVLYIGSVLGYMFSYAMGQKIRDVILRNPDKYWFKKKHLDYTEEFFGKYGDKTVVIGRFIPIVRSFAPTLAGSVRMPYRKFIRDVLIGGFLWTGGLTSIGFYLGRIIPHADRFLTPIIICIIFVSLLPAIIEYINRLRKRNKISND
ncbi:MAG TPA: DedA family protein [Candidatus Paceibacterota bacterium]